MHDSDRRRFGGGFGAGRLYGHLEGRLCSGDYHDVRRQRLAGYDYHMPPGGRPAKRLPEYDLLHGTESDGSHGFPNAGFPSRHHFDDQLRHLGTAPDGT